MTEYVPVIWMDYALGTVQGTQINKERLDQMQTQYKLTSGSRTMNIQPSDPKNGDWYYDDSKETFCIFSNGWKTILWTGSDLATNKPLKWNGSEIFTDNLQMEDVTGLGNALANKADISLLDNKADVSALDGKADLSLLDGKADVSVVDGKVDKIDGKGLSSKDYTETEKTKLAGISENANMTVIDSTWQSSQNNDTVPGTKLVKDSLESKAHIDSSGRVTDVEWCGLMNFNDATAKALGNPNSRFSFQCDPASAGNPFNHTNYLIMDMWAMSPTAAMVICYDNVYGYRATRQYWGDIGWRAWKTRKGWETIYDETPEIDVANGTSTKFGNLESGKEVTFRLTIRRESYYQIITMRFSNNGYGVSLYDAPTYNENQPGYRIKTIFSRQDSSTMKFRTLYSFMTSEGNTNWTQQGGNSYFIVKIEKEVYI